MWHAGPTGFLENAMYYRFLFLIVWALAGCASAAQRLLTTPGAAEPIELQSLRISAEISGAMAQTTVRLVFFNPNHRALEGQLQFPLLSGQHITAFALDIDGAMRAAVPVEKARGREIFEAVERRKVDPALLEQTQGNHFKLRIYPIPAMGSRTVELVYAEALGRDGARRAYRLPLAYGERLRDFDLSLSVQGDTAPPSASGALGAIPFSRQGRQFQAHVARSGITPDGMLRILVPAASEAQSYLQEHDGATYFVTEIPVAAAPAAARTLPKTVGLLWDSSGSGGARAHEAELLELDLYFKALKHATVRLTRLRDRAEAIQSFQVVNGNWDTLRQALRATVYDGASALADWQAQADVEEYLLLSDGLLNYGASAFPTLAPNQRLYALNSALAADTNRLAALAERTGGRLIQIEANKPGAAARALLSEPLRVSDLTAVGATDVLVDTADAQAGLLRVSGQLSSPHAQLTLTLVQQGKPKTVAFTVDADAPRHPLAAQLHALAKLRALDGEFETHRGAIRRLGMQFGIPTRETSLIVLDRLEDYVRYDIAPPDADLAQYRRLRDLRGAQLASSRQQHLEKVLRGFEQKVRWWEQNYPLAQRAAPRPLPAPMTNIPLGAMPTLYGMADAARVELAPAPVSARVSASAPAPLTARPAATASAAAPEMAITLKKWRADAPYIARMNAASAEQVYAVYLDEKPDYADSSAFFLDAADILFEKGQRNLGLRVLSNLAEMDLENRHVLRILGYRLLQAGAPELALPVFEKVRRMAEEEPQSFRDLGLAHAAAGHYQQAIDELNEVILRPWDARFAEIELITLAEMNAIIAAAPPLDTSRVDPRLLKNMPLDMRAVLSWDADNTDIDLWVTDPDGEKCYYGRRFTLQGGRMSLDFTGGYGPEEFSLRHAKPGKYKIEVNFFGSSQQIAAGATTVQVKLGSAFGTPAAQEKTLTVRLRGQGDSVYIGKFEVTPK
ncbi:Ca-activated chloride channel family protein [Oxalobacteraceae bacterium GrIS 1.11]